MGNDCRRTNWRPVQLPDNFPKPAKPASTTPPPRLSVGQVPPGQFPGWELFLGRLSEGELSGGVVRSQCNQYSEMLFGLFSAFTAGSSKLIIWLKGPEKGGDDRLSVWRVSSKFLVRFAHKTYSVFVAYYQSPYLHITKHESTDIQESACLLLMSGSDPSS